MTLILENRDNLSFNTKYLADIIFADYIYENTDFIWVDKYWQYLKPNGIFIAITDYHSAAEYKCYTQTMPHSNFVNWLIWKNEFGNFRKDRFRQCHDDIIIFSKGKDFYFDPEKVQVEKVTAKSKGLNPSGRTTKLATSVITDICITTISKERIKMDDGKSIRWQKPEELIERILLPFVKPDSLIVDPFMGSGTCGVVAMKLGCNYIGIEKDEQVFNLAYKRLHG